MNRDLFWRYLEAEHPRMEAFCRKLAGNRDDGDDLYQDALLTAITRLETLKNSESFKPWLYRIIVNMYKSRQRREWLRSRLRLEKSSDDPGISNDNSGQIGARIWLERAFRVVRPEDKALVTLYELDGWSVSEIAQMVGSPEGTIKSRLSRTRKKMRIELKKYLLETKLTELEANYALPRCKTTFK